MKNKNINNDFQIIDQDYIDFQKPIYDDAYLTDVRPGDWVYDDGEVLCGSACVQHWYSISDDDDEKERFRQIYEHLEKLNKKP